MKYYVIEESRLLRLISSASKFTALECGGVDNWTWYGESLYNYLSDCLGNDEDEDFGFNEVARMKIKQFPCFELAD